jgi:hypothetical protein
MHRRYFLEPGFNKYSVLGIRFENRRRHRVFPLFSTMGLLLING